MKLNKYPDKAGIAMIIFGLLLGISYLYFRHIWLVILGAAWIAIPLLLTVDDEDDH